MMQYPRAVVVVCLASCGYPALAPLDGKIVDAPAGGLTITAMPSQISVRVSEVRETMVVVTNATEQPVGTPVLAVMGFDLGTVVINGSTCTTPLAPGASCSAIAQLTAASPGQVDVQLTATATSVDPGSAKVAVTVRTACAMTCGANGTTNCCASSVVPGNAAGATLAGDTFYRGYDVATDSAYKDMGSSATVSDFRLDTYEVSVGRFREFLTAGYGTQNKPPVSGSGEHPHVVASGWDPTWNSNLSASTAALQTNLKCNAQFQTWTDTAGAGDARPINCITWFEAMAFCVWDGGFLPSEAEWNYAAAGGSQQRAYPWSSPPGSTTAGCSQANYGGANYPTSACVAPGTGGTNRVGSESAAGDGRWPQADLGGNVAEWVLDGNAPYVTPCTDCANLTSLGMRSIRGGSFVNTSSALRTNMRFSLAPNGRNYTYGVRCARSP